MMPMGIITVSRKGCRRPEEMRMEMRKRSQSLRRNMTKEECHLWYDFLKELPVMVHRQKVIGPYIVDFYIASAKLVIELDGSQHYDPSGQAADRQRDAYLRSLGLQVVRYSNADVNRNFRGVCEHILLHLPKPSP